MTVVALSFWPFSDTKAAAQTLPAAVPSNLERSVDPSIAPGDDFSPTPTGLLKAPSFPPAATAGRS